MNPQTLTFVSLILSGLAVTAGVYALIALHKARRWRRIFTDPEEQPENLEQIILSIASKIKNLQTGQVAHQEQLNELRHTLGFAVQHVGIVRYNSLADEGGNLSFSLALLDAHRNGFLVTSLHGRQQNRIYSKQITNGDSEVPLSEEERDAVFAAIKTQMKLEAKVEAKGEPKKIKALKPKLKRKPVKV